MLPPYILIKLISEIICKKKFRITSSKVLSSVPGGAGEKSTAGYLTDWVIPVTVQSAINLTFAWERLYKCAFRSSHQTSSGPTVNRVSVETGGELYNGRNVERVSINSINVNLICLIIGMRRDFRIAFPYSYCIFHLRNNIAV